VGFLVRFRLLTCTTVHKTTSAVCKPRSTRVGPRTVWRLSQQLE
jgi:hypothetical protein